jgi:hypothetical protein
VTNHSNEIYAIMKKSTIILSLVIMISSCTGPVKKAPPAEQKQATGIQVFNKGNVGFETWFANKTMRLDFFHSGTSKEEHFAKDRVISDGIWGGSKKTLIDDLNLGLYYYEIIDKESGLLLYSRGFASVFGEWQSIPEASETWGTFHESVRFPWPKKPVTVIIKKRDAVNNFATIWTTDIDPVSRQVNPAELINANKIDIIAENGPADQKVDIVILGDGYSNSEMAKFRKDAARLSGYLMNSEPFKSRSKDFNIRAIETPGETSGVNKPHQHVFNRTPLSVHYGSFDSERYALTYDNRTVRDIASAVPYDLMVILINERTYGGGGIYNLYSTVSADNKFAEYMMIHEMGHQIAGLADEYYTAPVSYEVPDVKVEPWELNITALFDSRNLKWKDLVEESTPLPTPWNKIEFDKFGYGIQKERDSLRAAMVPESVMEDLFTRQMKQEDEYFAREKYRDKVGAFEGAGYLAKGLYRPQVDCIMYSRHLVFCKVCNRSISRVIDQYVK